MAVNANACAKMHFLFYRRRDLFLSPCAFPQMSGALFRGSTATPGFVLGRNDSRLISRQGYLF